MFGIGFTELLLIAVIAILFLGPEKLPQALVEMGKFIKNIKRTIDQVKSSIEEEIEVDSLTKEALHYKEQLNNATNELKNFKNIHLDESTPISYDKKTPSDNTSTGTQVEAKNETVTMKKAAKKSQKSDS